MNNFIVQNNQAGMHKKSEESMASETIVWRYIRGTQLKRLNLKYLETMKIYLETMTLININK